MWWEQLTKTVLDSGFQADDSGFQALELLQVYNPGQKGWGDFSYPSPLWYEIGEWPWIYSCQYGYA